MPGRAEWGVEPRLRKGPRRCRDQAGAAEMILVQVLHRGRRLWRRTGRGGDGHAPAAERRILAGGAGGRVDLIEAPGGIVGHGTPVHLPGDQRAVAVVDEGAGGATGHRHAALAALDVIAVGVAPVALGAGQHGAVGVVGVGVGSAGGRGGVDVGRIAIGVGAQRPMRDIAAGIVGVGERGGHAGGAGTDGGAGQAVPFRPPRTGTARPAFPGLPPVQPLPGTDINVLPTGEQTKQECVSAMEWS